MSSAGGLLALIVSPALLAALGGAFDLRWAMLGAVLVLLATLRRHSTCALPSLLCLGGMALGLLVDGREIGPAMLASLCGASTATGAVVDHWLILPATNGLMATGALMAVALAPSPGQVPWRELACLPAMIAVMLLACHLGPATAELSGLPWGPGGLLTAMAVGMIWGEAMVDWAVLAVIRFRLARLRLIKSA